MTSRIASACRRIWQDDKGVTLVEYGIALALAITLGTAALYTLGGEVGASLGAAGAEMPD